MLCSFPSHIRLVTMFRIFYFFGFAPLLDRISFLIYAFSWHSNLPAPKPSNQSEGKNVQSCLHTRQQSNYFTNFWDLCTHVIWKKRRWKIIHELVIQFVFKLSTFVLREESLCTHSQTHTHRDTHKYLYLYAYIFLANICVLFVPISNHKHFFCRSVVHSTFYPFSLNFPFFYKSVFRLNLVYIRIFIEMKNQTKLRRKMCTSNQKNKRDECKSHTTKLSH